MSLSAIITSSAVLFVVVDFFFVCVGVIVSEGVRVCDFVFDRAFVSFVVARVVRFIARFVLLAFFCVLGVSCDGDMCVA